VDFDARIGFAVGECSECVWPALDGGILNFLGDLECGHWVFPERGFIKLLQVGYALTILRGVLILRIGMAVLSYC